ncbi:lanthionine synthetase LanC family protein [Paenibacillus larvae]|uniref:lanthionine synthetase LanC family protein n=1 Tax=Paenibacillus larvae TaxID=1464 RepID=UPI0009878069|nr:lanthionine synthetase LanC family protein [Paenibacillus larvae]MDV3430599.1 lanthionine synthetase LanC family protein [Paenibacillus larvae]MDV3483310.1 lanthionine synthetase LanC family protein [Paenibacillus larvae]
MRLSLETFIALAHRPEEDWNLHAPTLCHGFGGLLQMTQRMYAESGDDQLNVVRERLAWRILESFDRNTPFGFSEVIKTEHETSVLHSPGLLQGAAGTVLALLGLCSTQEPEWDQVLLIT